jgi:hypothetical protein
MRLRVRDNVWEVASDRDGGGGRAPAGRRRPAVPLPARALAASLRLAAGDFCGNFPQAFSHIGVIAAGVTLGRVLRADGHTG